MRDVTQRRVVWLCTALALLLGLIGLGNQMYWDDEANTAFVGREFVRTGELSAWDGRNLLSYGMKGSVSNDLKRASHPPLPYMLAGAGQFLFGQSVFGGRLLFLLIGIFTIPLASFWYRREFSGRGFWVVALVLALSVPFLLYIRNVRYYAPGLCFSVGMLWAWSAIPDSDRSWRTYVSGVLFMLLNLASQYLMAFGVIGIMCASLVRSRYRCRESLVALGGVLLLGIAGIAGALLYSPWVVRLGLKRVLERLDPDYFEHIVKLGIHNMTEYEFVPLGMLLGLISVVSLDAAGRSFILRNAAMLALYIFVTVWLIGLVSPHFGLDHTSLTMRYYILLIPLGALMAAVVFDALSRHRWKPLPWAFLVVLVASNLLTLNFAIPSSGPFADGQGLHSRPYQYLRENLTDYPTSYDAIAGYIREKIDEDDCIFVSPMYASLVFMYHTPEHKFCGLTSKEASFARANDNFSRLRRDIFFEHAAPKYFFIGGRPAREGRMVLDVLYGRGSYDLVETLPFHWRSTIRPEIPFRTFGAPELESMNDGVHVFVKKDDEITAPRASAHYAEPLLR